MLVEATWWFDQVPVRPRMRLSRHVTSLPWLCCSSLYSMRIGGVLSVMMWSVLIRVSATLRTHATRFQFFSCPFLLSKIMDAGCGDYLLPLYFFLFEEKKNTNDRNSLRNLPTVHVFCSRMYKLMIGTGIIMKTTGRATQQWCLADVAKNNPSRIIGFSQVDASRIMRDTQSVLECLG